MLSINGWSPVASHLACLFFGIALSNSIKTPTHKTERIYSNKAIIPISSSYLSNYYKDKWKINQQVFIARQDKNYSKPACRTNLGQAKLLKIKKKVILEVTKANAINYLKYLTSKAKTLYTLVPASQNLSFRPCKKQPKIVYHGR